jgi:hypothetical protein
MEPIVMIIDAWADGRQNLLVLMIPRKFGVSGPTLPRKIIDHLLWAKLCCFALMFLLVECASKK